MFSNVLFLLVRFFFRNKMSIQSASFEQHQMILKGNELNSDDRKKWLKDVDRIT